MRRSSTITITVNCPYAVAYEYLSDPATFGDWAGVAAGSYHQIRDTGEWAGLASNGQWRYRFTPSNSFGVLDHQITFPDGTSTLYPMRLIPNGRGCEIHFTYFADEGVEGKAFDSSLEWIRLDFEVLKSLLEPGAHRKGRR